MDLILLIVAIVYLVQRPGIARREAKDYPDVPADVFQQWKRLELRSRDIVIWVGFLWIPVAISLVAISIFLKSDFGYVLFGGLAVALTTLIIAATVGSKAAKIKKEYNIY